MEQHKRSSLVLSRSTEPTPLDLSIDGAVVPQPREMETSPLCWSLLVWVQHKSKQGESCYQLYAQEGRTKLPKAEM